MRWLAALLVLSLAPACTTQPDAPAAEEGAKKARKDEKGAKKKRSGDASRKKGDKAPQLASQATSGKQGRKPDTKVYGAAGPVVAELKLQEKTVGEQQRTTAQLRFTAGDKDQTLRLGGMPGSCVEAAEPATIDGAAALWTLECSTDQAKGGVAILQQGEELVISRAQPGSDTYKPVRRFRLAEGAELSRAE